MLADRLSLALLVSAFLAMGIALGCLRRARARERLSIKVLASAITVLGDARAVATELRRRPSPVPEPPRLRPRRR